MKSLNSPLPTDLAGECRKAAKILNSFIDPGHGLDKSIPPNIIGNAKGLAIFTVFKAGFLFSGRAGSGLVVARLPDGSWSAPSAIGTGGMGIGGQIGAEITDFVVILNNKEAVKTFSHGGSVTLGGNLSVAAGPVGRNAEAAGSATYKHFAAIYSYSKTKGLFAGVSVEGSVMVERSDANTKFYGREISAKELLNGTVPQPPQADVLYRALNSHLGRIGFKPDENDAEEDPDAENARPRGQKPFRPPPPSYPRESYRVEENSDAESVGSRSHRSFQAIPPPYPREPYKVEEDMPPKRRPVPPPPPPKVRRDPTATALYDYQGQQDGDLSFNKGDMIVITKKSDSSNDWWTGRIGGREGSFPANYVQLN